MKKLILLALGVVFVFASCKKDYDCMVNGEVWSTCNDCNAQAKTVFKTDCSVWGGVVVEQ